MVRRTHEGTRLAVMHHLVGAEFYGKRKSNFYGKDDPNKTSDPTDKSEQYQGPTGESGTSTCLHLNCLCVGGGYFRRDAEGRPVTRKGTPLYDEDA